MRVAQLVQFGPILLRGVLATLTLGSWLAVVDFCVGRFAIMLPIGASELWALFLTHTLMASIFVLAMAAIVALGEGAFHAWGRERPLRRLIFVSTTFAFALLPSALALGQALAKGEWIAQQWFAPLVRFGLAGAALLGAVAVVVHVAWTKGRRFWLACWLAGSALLGFLNGYLFVGYYPEFHLTLYAFSTGLGYVAFFFLFTRLTLARRTWLGATAFGACVAAACWGALALDASTRDRAARASAVLPQLLTSFVPPAARTVLQETIVYPIALTPSLPAPPVPPSWTKPRNVVVLTIDTLRADALPPVRNKESLSAKPGDTPFLDRWLESSYRFRNAYSQATRTSRSVPATFFSCETFEDPLALGARPPALWARELGLTPVAVLADWFLLPNAADASVVLDGFDSVRSYRRNGAQERFLPLANQILKEVGEKPFFLWLHYFGMHLSPFIGKGNTHPDGASYADKYRAALRYMDRQIEQLVGLLEAKDAVRDTVFVLMSDHGELIGERGLLGHGQGVSEAEAHVPLAIWVPGGGSGTVEALAGNIDIFPTLAQLFGSEAGAMRGQSLVPEMAKLAKESDRKLYITSGNGKYLALVTQKHKLQFAKQAGSFSLFERSDTFQDFDSFGQNPLLDQQLVGEFVRRDPLLFEDQLRKRATRAALTTELATSPNGISLEQLSYLLQLAAISHDAEVHAIASTVFDRAKDDERRRLAVLRLHRLDREFWGARATAVLKRARGGDEEIALVRQMTDAGVRGIAEGYVTKRLNDLAEDCTAPLNQAWLGLAAKQRLRGDAAASAIKKQFACAQRSDAPLRVVLLGRILVTTSRLKMFRDRELERDILPLLDDEDEWVAVAALRALGSVGSKKSVKKLRARLDTDSRVKQSARIVEAAILSLARLEGAKVTPLLVKWGKIPMRQHAVYRALGDYGDARGIPYLKKASKEAMGMASVVAKNALRAARARLEP